MPGLNIIGKCGVNPVDVLLPPISLLNLTVALSGTRVTVQPQTGCQRTFSDTIGGSFFYSHTRIGSKQYIDSGFILPPLTFVYYSNGCCVRDLILDNSQTDEDQPNGSFNRACTTDCPDPVCDGQDISWSDLNIGANVIVSFVAPDYKEFTLEGNVVLKDPGGSSIWSFFFSSGNIPAADIGGAHLITITQDGWQAAITINFTT